MRACRDIDLVLRKLYGAGPRRGGATPPAFAKTSLAQVALAEVTLVEVTLVEAALAEGPLSIVSRPRRNMERCEQLAQPVGKLLPVVASHRLVGDARRHFVDARFERSAALRRVERAGFALAHP